MTCSLPLGRSETAHATTVAAPATSSVCQTAKWTPRAVWYVCRQLTIAVEKRHVNMGALGESYLFFVHGCELGSLRCLLGQWDCVSVCLSFLFYLFLPFLPFSSPSPALLCGSRLL